MSALPAAELWTDGACSGNPGPGGWAAVLRVRKTLPGPPAGVSDINGHFQAHLDKLRTRGLLIAACDADDTPGPLDLNPGHPVHIWVERELSGGERRTTNNRMEIMGLLEGLAALNRATRVKVHLDSRYVMDAFEKGWLRTWQRNGWRTSAKQPVANRDLWEPLLAQYARHQVSFTWVQGHAGVTHNERADKLAVAARDRAARS